MYRRVGHARTQAGAIRAASIRVAKGEFAAADIYNDVGDALYSIRFTGRVLTVTGKFYDLEAT
jgi:hypothetical protein